MLVSKAVPLLATGVFLCSCRRRPCLAGSASWEPPAMASLCVHRQSKRFRERHPFKAQVHFRKLGADFV